MGDFGRRLGGDSAGAPEAVVVASESRREEEEEPSPRGIDADIVIFSFYVRFVSPPVEIP
jgi:7,8-dihydro-6-hydroxymethylpterin-pyrophosphokinase